MDSSDRDIITHAALTDEGISRRRLLAFVGVGTTLPTISGCLGMLRDRLTPSIQLGWFGVQNFDTTSHRFELRVIRDGTQVHYSTHTVRGQEGNQVYGAVAECTWGSDAGQYTVAARLTGSEWTERPLSELADTYTDPIDCATAEARYRNGEMSIAFLPDCDRVSQYEGGCSFTSSEA